MSAQEIIDKLQTENEELRSRNIKLYGILLEFEKVRGVQCCHRCLQMCESHPCDLAM